MRVDVAPEAVTAEIDGATVVLTPDMQFVRLDETGGAIWQFVQDGCDVDGVVDGLCERYAVDRATAARDVDVFLAALADVGLVTLER